MQSAVCMGGLGSKFGIKCMTYNKVGIFYILCGFYERKKKMFSLLEMWNSVEQSNAKTTDSSGLAICHWS